jgi:hypothetical protein
MPNKTVAEKIFATMSCGIDAGRRRAAQRGTRVAASHALARARRAGRSTDKNVVAAAFMHIFVASRALAGFRRSVYLQVHDACLAGPRCVRTWMLKNAS